MSHFLEANVGVHGERHEKYECCIEENKARLGNMGIVYRDMMTVSIQIYIPVQSSHTEKN